jgi:uncharacterized protein YbgA (DUF1722 family)
MPTRPCSENSKQIDDAVTRQQFLARNFALAEFRQILRENPTRGALVDFHSRHKHLLLACDEEKLRRMGPLVAACGQRSLEEILEEYGELLTSALAKTPRRSSIINVLQHAFGYFNERVSAPERMHFLGLIEEYREGRIPLSALLTLLWSWILRFDESYLASQSFYRPRPRLVGPPEERRKGEGT